LNKNSVFFEKIGNTQENNLFIQDELDLSIDEIEKLNNSWFRKYIN